MRNLLIFCILQLNLINSNFYCSMFIAILLFSSMQYKPIRAYLLYSYTSCCGKTYYQILHLHVLVLPCCYQSIVLPVKACPLYSFNFLLSNTPMLHSFVHLPDAVRLLTLRCDTHPEPVLTPCYPS